MKKSRAGQGGFKDWESLRTHTIEAFQGETPHPVTEDEIMETYEAHPAAVEKAVGQVAADLASGQARSGWGVLRARATAIRTARGNPEGATSRDREKVIARAEQWMRAAGMHFDVAYEVEDELFGERGQLRPYAQVDYDYDEATYHRTGDLKLIERMLDLWRTQRPIGEKIEADSEQRATEWKASRAHVQAVLRPKTAEYEAALPEPEYALVGQTPPPDEALYDPDREPPT